MQEGSKRDAIRIGYALLGGLVIGLVIHYIGAEEYASYLKPLGTIFVRLLKMVIVPLVFCSIFMSMINLGTPEALGSMGKKAMSYYFMTTLVAAFIGLVLVNIIEPGTGVSLGNAGLDGLSSDLANKVSEKKDLWQTVLNVFIDAIPINPASSLANANVLQIIFFAILLGIATLYTPKNLSNSARSVMASFEEVTLTLTHGVMKFAPFGIFALMLDVMAKSGTSAIISLSKYISTVLIGLFIHFIFLLIIGCTRLRKSPLFILREASTVIFTSFSTASSAATIPVNLTAAEENFGVRKETAKFVIPLGATVNMDGTALYESVAAIFIAQAYGFDLSLTQQVIIFMTASLAAMGAAAIPGAGLVTMSIVLGAVGLPIEGIGLILSVDRILDMFRTSVNVFGDLMGAIVVDSFSDSKKQDQDEDRNKDRIKDDISEGNDLAELI